MVGKIEIKCKGNSLIDVDLLNDFQGDLKTISKDNLEKFKKQILELGFSEPVSVWVDNGVYYILNGHQRIKAVKELIKEGYSCDDIPISIVEAKDRKEAKKKVLALTSAYGEIEQKCFDIFIKDADLDFEELDNFVLDNIDIKYDYLTDTEKDDEVPEAPKVAKTVLGDIIELGNHRLMCGDCTIIDNVDKLMNGQKADMVFTDPPYGMKLNTDWSSAKSDLDFVREKHTASQGNRYNKVIGDNEDFRPELISSIFANFGYCKEIFLWGGDYYADLLPDRNIGSWVVWDKRLNESADKMYGSCFELCWSKSRHKRMIARIKWAGIFGTEKEPDKDKSRKHPTQKPVELVNWFFEYYSLKDKQLVVDMFGGSGSTLIACEKTNRKCYTMELDPIYCDVIIQRYCDYTGNNKIKVNGVDITWGDTDD